MDQQLSTIARSIVDLTAEGYGRDQLAETLGVSVPTITRMLARDPGLREAVEQAAEVYAPTVLEWIRDVPSNEAMDPQRARVCIEAWRTYLELRFPSRFGKRMELTVHKGLDMQSALDQARKRAGLIDKSEAQDVDYVDVSADMATDSLSVAAAGIDDLL